MDFGLALLPFGIAVLVFGALTGIRVFALPFAPEWIRTALAKPLWLLCFAVAIGAGFGVALLPENVAHSFTRFAHVLFVVSATWAASNVAVAAVRRSLKKIESPMGDSGVIYVLIRVVIFLVGTLMVFSALDIAISPILTAFGVAGLAVALAVKDTLENLFSGVHLLIDKAVSVGDWIRLENGQEGAIIDIGWRTTKLRMANGDLLILPNVKFAQGILIKKQSGG